uniref:Transposase n=1 Tax=Angiostrongylus cantonensis TaxID=6313 RepID=A0A0K0DRT0_ANGCA
MQCAGLSKAAKNTPHSVNWVVIPKGYLHDRKYPCLGAIHINGKGNKEQQTVPGRILELNLVTPRAARQNSA